MKFILIRPKIELPYYNYSVIAKFKDGCLYE